MTENARGYKTTRAYAFPNVIKILKIFEIKTLH